MYNFVPNIRYNQTLQSQTEYYIVSYVTKKFGIKYQGFLLRYCTQGNKFNCVFPFRVQEIA